MPATNELLQEGRYRISHSSTHGTGQDMFEAYDTVRNTNVVVREIPVKLNRVTTVSQRESIQLAFANQAKALTEIEHESLVHVHDYFYEIDRQYLVMEAIEGENLGKMLKSRNKPFSVGEVTNWADQLLDALNYLHSRKPAIIHRHINPSNVTLHPSGKIKLIGVGVESGSDSDFSSTPADGDDLRYSPMEQIWPGLDAASQKVITNSYDDRSERILKEPLDERSDIYSLGATLYYLITGVEPVDPIERSIEILEGKLDPLREPTKVDSSIPPEISDVLMKSLEIKRENRYDSAVIMRQVLKTALTRVAEREQEENREQQEAAEILRQAAQAKADSSAIAEEKQREAAAEEEARRLEAEAAEQRRLEAEAAEQKRREVEAAEQKRLEAEAEQKRQKELMQRQLQEAEEQRRQAEQAEADRILREIEEAERAKAEADAAKPQTPEDNLLEIPVPAEVVAYRDNAAVEEDELAAVLKELEEAEASVAEVITYDTPLDLDSQPSAPLSSSLSEDDDKDIFSVPEKSGSSLPIPTIAGGIVLVVVIAIGAWFMLSGSPEPPKPAPTPVIETAQPAPAETSPATDTIVSSQTDANTATVDPAAEQAEQAASASKPAPTAKVKKETAKVAPEKKKVTVDDLINDN